MSEVRDRGKPHYERWFFKIFYTPEIFGLISTIFRWFGRRFYTTVARGISWTYAMTQYGVRETVRDNLAILLGRETTKREAVRVFTQFGHTIGDYIAVGNMPTDEAEALCDEKSGFEHLKSALEAGRGAILVTGHYGFFEFGALLMRQFGFPTTVVTLSEHTPELTRWRADFRRRWGAETIEIGPDAFSSLRVVRALEDGRFAAMLVDRPAGDYVQNIELAGGQIPFSRAPALIAYLGNCPVIPVAVTRKPSGLYRIVAKPGIWPKSFGDSREECIERSTVAIAASLFEEIAKDPSQWYHFVPVAK